MVRIATGEGNLRDGLGACAKQVAGGVDPDFDEVLSSGDVEQRADALVELVDRKSSHFCELGEAERLIVVAVDVIECGGKCGEVAIVLSRWVEIAGDAANSADLSIFPDDGLFKSEAPSAASAGVKVEFQVVTDRCATAEDGAVLEGEGAAERCGKKSFGGEADGVFLRGEAAARGEGVIHRHVAPLRVFDEKNDVRDAVKQQVHGQWAFE